MAFIKHTEEAKKKISEGRKLYLAVNPDKHPWKKADKLKSVSCEKLKAFLKLKGLQFVEEFNPIADRAFAIDIAFPDIKLGIEVNGNQHYQRDGSFHEYYQQRHDLIVAAGWTLIELHYSTCHNQEMLEKIIG